MASSVMGMLRSDVRLATPHLQTGRSHPDTGPAACRSTVPRERFTPVARPDQSDRSDEVRFSGKTGSGLAEGQTGAFDPEQTFEQWHDAYFD
jgi:hypothetical protein